MYISLVIYICIISICPSYYLSFSRRLFRRLPANTCFLDLPFSGYRDVAIANQYSTAKIVVMPHPYYVSSVQTTTMANKPYIINNFLMHIYHSLKGKERYVEEGKSRSFYEAFWDSAETAFVIPHRPSNSEVEAFYRGSLTMNEFIQKVQDRVLSKTKIKLDKDLKPLNSLSWSVYSTVPGRKEACDRVPKECALQLWTMFNKLDTECNGFVHTADLTELILKLYEVNNKEENEENIQEWFCSQMEVDFWSFFSALENHLYLIQRRPVEGLYKVHCD